MVQEDVEWHWMRNKDFYLGIIEGIIERMMRLDMTVEDLSQAAGVELKRLNHILDGLIEDLTLLELDNLLIAVNVTPRTFAVV